MSPDPRRPPSRSQAHVKGLGTARVVGRSMAPTLVPGDLLLVRWGVEPSPGDLVLARLPGDRPLAVKRATSRRDGGWWLERDNPAEGVDSWLVGAVPDDAVLAVVVARLWPRPRRLGARAAPGPG